MGASPKFLRLSRLKRLREAEQVAAVCYRMRGAEIEFLLVQTGGGRWIFPKGGVEPGLTHAQAAAVEAFEEAGVHGRIEEAPFARYQVRRQGKQGSGKQIVAAHLCEVRRLGPPQETGRNRTWFSPEKTKRCLRDHRMAEDGAELARVVSRALVHIRRSQNKSELASEVSNVQPKSQKDSLQKVQFETSAIQQPESQIEALYMRYIQRLPVDAERGAEQDIAASFLSKPVLQLRGTTSASAMQNVTAIDQARRGRARN